MPLTSWSLPFRLQINYYTPHAIHLFQIQTLVKKAVIAQGVTCALGLIYRVGSKSWCVEFKLLFPQKGSEAYKNVITPFVLV